jgi:transposase InsO family protein
VLRSNNGGEYIYKEFGAFCRDVGIKRKLIVSYNPQQNGVTRRKNVDIIEVAKAMIHDLICHIWEVLEHLVTS